MGVLTGFVAMTVSPMKLGWHLILHLISVNGHALDLRIAIVTIVNPC